MEKICQFSDLAHQYWATAIGFPLGIFAFMGGIALCMWIAYKSTN